MANSGTGENSGHFPADSKFFKDLFRKLNKQYFVKHTQRPNQAIIQVYMYFISIIYLLDSNLFKNSTTGGFEIALAKSATMEKQVCEFGYEEPERFNTASEVVDEVARLHNSVEAKVAKMAEQRYPDRYPVDLMKQIK